MSMEISREEKEQLIEQAAAAGKMAYAPYSGYLVGAALLTESGRIYTGCNVENASFGAANCAERTAFFKAVSEGEREFKAIAIVGKGVDAGTSFPEFAYPCGICRQVMLEFCREDFTVLVARDSADFRE